MINLYKIIVELNDFRIFTFMLLILEISSEIYRWENISSGHFWYLYFSLSSIWRPDLNLLVLWLDFEYRIKILVWWNKKYTKGIGWRVYYSTPNSHLLTQNLLIKGWIKWWRPKTYAYTQEQHSSWCTC